MHSSNIFDFCEGHLETYYLQWHLDARPDLTGTVVADLPEEVFMESSSRPSLTISSSTKRKKEKDSEIANAIRDLKTSWKDPELSKKKLAMLQKQEERWDAEQFFWQQDYVLKQQEEARKTREHIFNKIFLVTTFGIIWQSPVFLNAAMSLAPPGAATAA